MKTICVGVGTAKARCQHCGNATFLLPRKRSGPRSYVCEVCRTRSTRAELVGQIATQICCALRKHS